MLSKVTGGKKIRTSSHFLKLPATANRCICSWPPNPIPVRAGKTQICWTQHTSHHHVCHIIMPMQSAPKAKRSIHASSSSSHIHQLKFRLKKSQWNQNKQAVKQYTTTSLVPPTHSLTPCHQPYSPLHQLGQRVRFSAPLPLCVSHEEWTHPFFPQRSDTGPSLRERAF